MAHEIAQTSDGRDAFAYAGDPGWHGLGQEVTKGAPIEVWARESGMDYTIEAVPLSYTYAGKQSLIDDRVAQIRSDTGTCVGIVSPKFQTVQPRGILEFFRHWADINAAQIETAGSLKGGSLYFALARIGETVDLGNGDKVAPFVYLSTACDGTRQTEERNVVTRVVCANTDRAARGEGKAMRSTSHKSIWDAVAGRANTEAMLAEFGAYCSMARTLRGISLDTLKATALTEKLIGAAKTPKGRDNAAFASIMAMFQGEALGSDLDGVKGTAWGYLNAVTEFVDHKVRATSDDNRTVAALFGPGDAIKAKARELVLAI